MNRAAPNAPSVVYDAVFIPGGASVSSLTQFGPAIHFVNEAYSHGKAIAAAGEGVNLLSKTAVPSVGPGTTDAGLITGDDVKSVLQNFIVAIGNHRVFTRETEIVPA